MDSPLRRERLKRQWTQEEVADRLRALDPEVGIDANTVSRHERGIHIPRRPYPELYAQVFEVEVGSLFPRYHEGMERRTFLQAVGVASLGGLLESAGDDSLEALKAITAGLRRLEATTPSGELRGPVLAHLRLIGQDGTPERLALVAETARLAAWLAWDQDDHPAADRLYKRAAGAAERAGNGLLAAHIAGSRALWMAETGQGKRAVPAAQGVQVADHPWFSTMRATLASSVGDADETLAALKMAERQLHQECDSLFIDPFGYAKLQGYAGRAYVRLRLYKAAEPALREALVGVGATKYRGVLLCDLARVVSSEEAMELQREARELGQRFQSRKVLKAAAA